MIKLYFISFSFIHFTMPKVSDCCYSRCAQGLKVSERENFKPSEEAHWRACHVDEPVKFLCPYTGVDVEIRRNPEDRYFFTCMCLKSRLLSGGSVKRHYAICPVVKRHVTQQKTSQSTGETSTDQRTTSEHDSLAHGTSPSMSSTSEIVHYDDCKFFIYFFLHPYYKQRGTNKHLL